MGPVRESFVTNTMYYAVAHLLVNMNRVTRCARRGDVPIDTVSTDIILRVTILKAVCCARASLATGMSGEGNPNRVVTLTR